MGKSSPPPPPDPNAVAAAQTQSNQQTALYNTNINRANQTGPNGSVAWTLRPGADPANPQPGDYTQTTSLSPEQQSLADSQSAISQNLAGVAQAGLSRVGAGMATPFDTSQLGTLAQQVGHGDNAGAAQQAQRAIMAQLQPQLDVNREQTENRLLNSGIEKGTQAWDDAQRVLGVNENNANLQSVQAGNTQANNLFGQDLQSSQFQNQSLQQGIAQQAYLRQLPLNELNSLRTGSQVQAPTFSGYYTGGQSGATDVAGITQTGYNQQVAGVNAQNAQTANNTAGAVSAIGMAAAAY